MPRLYIANCTKQNQRVFYRLDINQSTGELIVDARFRQAKHQDIPMGRQAPIAGDLHINQINAIVEQLNRFGMVGAVDLNRLPDAVVPFLFNIDRPLTVDQIKEIHDHNDGVMMRDGKERRVNAAVAAAAVMEVAKLDVSIEQETVSELDESPIEEGFKVSPDPVHEQPTTPARKRAARNASV